MSCCSRCLWQQAGETSLKQHQIVVVTMLPSAVRQQWDGAHCTWSSSGQLQSNSLWHQSSWEDSSWYYWPDHSHLFFCDNLPSCPCRWWCPPACPRHLQGSGTDLVVAHQDCSLLIVISGGRKNHLSRPLLPQSRRVAGLRSLKKRGSCRASPEGLVDIDIKKGFKKEFSDRVVAVEKVAYSLSLNGIASRILYSHNIGRDLSPPKRKDTQKISLSRNSIIVSSPPADRLNTFTPPFLLHKDTCWQPPCLRIVVP